MTEREPGYARLAAVNRLGYAVTMYRYTQNSSRTKLREENSMHNY
jgi:hypothetical protein